MEALLELKGVSRGFAVRRGIFDPRPASVKAVNEVDLKLMPGETLGLVGESGCGKSTLARMAVGLLPPSSGEIWLSGRKLSFSATEQRVLHLLYENRERTVGVQEIESILGEQAEKSNAVAVYLYRLRRKLEQDGVTRIRTVRGAGYRWIGE